MAKRRYLAGYNRSSKVFNRLVIDALVGTPAILLGGSKRSRKTSINKWLKLF